MQVVNYKELLINKDKVVMASVDLACIIGDCEEAIALNQISYWLERYKEINRNFKDGRFWVYNSYQKWHHDNFPFWHPSKIQRIFRSLENKGLLLSANLNSAGFDKTKWYSIDYEKLQEMADEYEHKNKKSLIENERPLIENEQWLIKDERPLIAGDYPIPENTTEDTTEVNKYILSGTPDSTPPDASVQPKKTKKSKPKSHPEEVKQIVEYFNRVCDTNYKYQSKSTADIINARLNDGFTVEDFYKVIDTKHAEWANDPDMCKYIRPQTLFRPSHFENYLNQRSSPQTGEKSSISREMSELYNALIIE